MNSVNHHSLTYMESAQLYPTREARFYAARRLRMQNGFAYWGQIICSLCLIYWSIRPAFGMSGPVNIGLYAAFASVAILAMTLAQQAAGYIDRARSLEASARRIDEIRRQISAEIAAGNDVDSYIILKVGRNYSRVLEEFPINHTPFDYRYSKPGLMSFLVMASRAGALSLAVTGLVVAYPFVARHS